MGLYERYVLPVLLHLGCSQPPVTQQRAEVVPGATGRVLEIGIGSGLNLSQYDPDSVCSVLGIDPSAPLLDRARRAARASAFPVWLLRARAEQLPLRNASIDTVVLTYTLCTIPGRAAALAEMRRVLTPDGTLLFLEHGLSPDVRVRRWQNRLNPLWRAVAGGCNLTVDVPSQLERAGFQVQDLHTAYLPGPRVATFNYWGRAEPVGSGPAPG